MSVASVDDSLVYSFALRVAVLAHAIANSQHTPQPATALPATNKPSTATTSAASLNRPGFRAGASSSVRGGEGWTSALSSVGDAFSRADPSKPVKLPKEFIKTFTASLAQAEQHPSPDADPLLRKCLAAFRTHDWTDAFREQVKSHRKAEEVILRFVTRASGVVRADTIGDEWKDRLNKLVSDFVSLIRASLSQIKGGPTPELLARLETYTTKLVPAHPPRTSSRTATSLSATSSTGSTSDSGPSSSTAGFKTNVRDMDLVQAVGNLFGKSEPDLTRDVVALRRLCTEKAAFTDLKLCINQLAQGAKFPARREDFDSDEAFAGWKKQENKELQELLLGMLQRSPELVMSNVQIDDEAEPSFVFVPPDPKLYYKRLFEIALDYDYDRMKDLPPDEDVSLTILSPIHEQLLHDCATRWRVMQTVKPATFLHLISQHYFHQGVPEACVAEAIVGVDRLASAFEYDRWPWADRQFLFQALSTAFDTLLTRFFEIFQGILQVPFADVVDLLEDIHANEVFAEDMRGLPELLDELKVGMRQFVGMAYEEKQADLDSQERAHDLEPFLAMLDWIKAELKGYDRQFPKPLLGRIDVPELFIAIAGPEFVHHLDGSRPMVIGAADDDLLALYRGTVELEEMHNAFVPDAPLKVEYSSWFEPFVMRWLGTIDTKTTEWVQRAIEGDSFTPEGADGHSSSIVDLIASCKSACDFLKALGWPDENDNARYMTRLSQTIAKSIEQYSSTLETLFLKDMFPQKSNEAIDQDVARPSAWLTKAKLAVQGDKKVEPFTFTPESCVKLNNIQAARSLLDTMYNALEADKVSRLVEMMRPPQANVPTPQSRFLFTVKIVLGENLASTGASSSRRKLDPFLILSDPAGYRVAKTRTLYETNDPRWDETVDVSVKGELWLRATAYSRNLVDDHEKIGYAYIHLAPAKFADFLAQDIWYRLEDANRQPLDSRLLLRISMEGEKDDIQFYFGRAFRSLKRAENDMTRTMVDKMSPFVRHYLSHATLKQLVKQGFNFDLGVDIDLNKVKGNISNVGGKLNAIMRDLTSNQNPSLIPPVHDDDYRPSSPSAGPASAASRKKGRDPLTDIEIEDAVGPLLDYLNETFPTLKESLSEQAWGLVITRLWKEILGTLESLILPPLSDRPTEMRALSDKEVDIVFKWLGFLVNFFHSGGEGVPLEQLRNGRYQRLLEARMYYDWSADALMEEAVRSMQRSLAAQTAMMTPGGRGSIVARTKSVYQQRNLGTIRARKQEKQKDDEQDNGEIILRILRMHPGSSDFLKQQLSTLARLQADQTRLQQQATRSGGSLLRRAVGSNGTAQAPGRNRLARGSSRMAVPPVPTLPE